MIGFYISNYINNIKLEYEYKGDNYIYRNFGKYNVQSLVLDRYINDKIFFENDDYVIMTDGVILNSKELCKSKHISTLEQYIIQELDSGNLQFYQRFRGSFSGAFYIKKENKLYAYVDHIGDRPVFIYKNNDKYICTSALPAIVNTLKLNNEKVLLNEDAMYNLLTYGHMEDTETPINEVVRLRAGHYAVIETDKVITEQYYMLDNTKLIDASEDEIIDMIDTKFRNAVRMEYEKDIEYGYRHLSSLSGGLDARMSLWVARDLGYEHIQTCTFSQSGYLDEKIAEKMAAFLRCDYIFKSLDDADFMTNLDEIVKTSYGMSDSSSIMHALHMMEKLDYRNIGMLHTGQLGDVILGTYLHKEEDIKPYPFPIAYSYYLADKNKDKSFEKYKNLELFILYTRGFQGVLASQIMHSHYIEMISAFLDVDFLELCMSIPLKYRLNHRIYKKWILEKYPNAAKFQWEKIDGKITTPNIFLKVKHFSKLVYNKLRKELRNGMQPYDYWYNNYKDIKSYMDSYFDEGIKLKGMSDKLKTDMEDMYKSVSAREKIQVLTVLSIVKNYIDAEINEV